MLNLIKLCGIMLDNKFKILLAIGDNMKSIQLKILTIVLSSILILAIVITAISMFYMQKTLNTDSDIITESVANTEALRINDYIRNVEYGTDTIRNYVQLTLRDQTAQLADESYRSEYEKAARVAFNAPMMNIDGLVGFYLRFAPEIVNDEYTGFYSYKPNPALTDFVQAEDMTALVDWSGGEWFDIPKAKGEATWISPYICHVTAQEIVSYVTPIYVDNKFVAVAGVDISFSKLSDMVSDVSVYDNGFAYLAKTEDGGELGEIVFSPVDHDLLVRSTDHDHGFAEERMSLRNGMTLVIHADYSDIQRESYRMTMIIVLIVVVFLIGFITVTYILTKRIVRPLRDLTLAAEVLADGKTDLKLDNCKTNDEIGVLAEAFEKTAEKLHGYMSYINALAYCDSLTGVKNMTAYKEAVTNIDLKITMGEQMPFAILVTDINGLKSANDRYGHEIGNRLIVRATKLICNVFKHSPVFRVGGDEFVVLLEGEDFENRDALIASLDEFCTRTYVAAGEETIPVSIARGIECFDSNLHTGVEQIINRADKRMYEHKKSIKETGTV